MIYLIVKTLVLLLIAGGGGFALGWVFRGAQDRERTAALQDESERRVRDLRAERDAAEARLAAGDAGANADLAQKLASAEGELLAAREALTAAEAETSELAQGEEAAYGAAAAPGGGELRATKPAAPAAAPATWPIDKPADGGDDLTRISGVGPKLAATLQDLGVWTYAQIAAFSAEDVAAVDDKLTFKGRIERDDWISQAKLLAAGEDPKS